MGFGWGRWGSLVSDNQKPDLHMTAMWFRRSIGKDEFLCIVVSDEICIVSLNQKLELLMTAMFFCLLSNLKHHFFNRTNKIDMITVW